MRATPSRIRTGTLLLAVAVLAGCTTTGGATPTSSGPTRSAVGPGTGLLPVWHRTLSAVPDDATLWNLDRVGFVDTTGRLVVEPSYVRYDLCPGPDATLLVVAQAEDRVDVLDADGTVVASTPAGLSGCGPLPGYVSLDRQAGDEWEMWAATLPDLSRTDLPATGVAVDDDWLLVTSYSDFDTGTPTVTSELVDRYGNHVATDGDTGWDYFLLGDNAPLSTGEWPVPAAAADDRQGYLDRSGHWMEPPQLTTARPFVHGYAAVADDTSSHFVDTSFDQVGPDYGMIWPLYTAGYPFVDVLGYTVSLSGGGWPDDPDTALTGLLTPDLKVLADPETARTECAQSYDTPEVACLVVDGAGPRLIALPDGTSTPLPDGFTAVLSSQLVATDDGTRVLRVATGDVFDVPAPFHAVTDAGWLPGADAFVTCVSDNGLRLVLDATGATTPLASVEQTVTTTDGTEYYWVYAGDQQGWVDAAGAWLYRESRHQLQED